MSPLRILIVDDHELIRDGLRSRLEAHDAWEVCGEAVNGREAIELARMLQPNVVVLDVSMPDLNGIEAARRIRKECPGAEILILTMQQSEGLVRDALAAGARGFILKTDTSRLLIAAVEALAMRQPFFTGKVSELVLGGFLDPEKSSSAESARRGSLSPREREIAQLLAEAQTSKDVAAKLGVSVKTIDAHRANIMRKLDLHSIAELVRYAIREKLIEP